MDANVLMYKDQKCLIHTTDEKEEMWSITKVGPPTATVNNATCKRSFIKSTCANTGVPMFLKTIIQIFMTVATLE